MLVALLAVLAALIGVGGVLLGIVLNEYLRRGHRIEIFAAEVFQKRLEIYEELYQRIYSMSDAADDIIENDEYSKTQRHALVGHLFHDLFAFTDMNALFIDEGIMLQCVTLVMGVEDIHDITDSDERKKETARFRTHYLSAVEMIKKESGVTDIDKVFKSITQADHRSDVIDRLKELRAEQKAGSNVAP